MFAVRTFVGLSEDDVLSWYKATENQEFIKLVNARKVGQVGIYIFFTPSVLKSRVNLRDAPFTKMGHQRTEV